MGGTEKKDEMLKMAQRRPDAEDGRQMRRDEMSMAEGGKAWMLEGLEATGEKIGKKKERRKGC